MVSSGAVFCFLAMIRNSFPGVVYFATNRQSGQDQFWDSFLETVS
jgi:hypothetical protein